MQEIITVENVSKKFSKNLKRSLFYGLTDTTKELLFLQSPKNYLRPTEFWSIRNVSFSLKKGLMLGLTGLNGAGKSTLLKLINGILKPDVGKITINGRVGALIELGTGFNPILSGRENIHINASILGMTKKEIDYKLDEIVDFSGIEKEFIEAPIKTYSSGMLARLGFSVAVNLQPDILLIDEILSVGDVTFREKSFNKLMEFKKKGGTIILVSHLSKNIESFCDEAILLEKGSVVAQGTATSVMEEYGKRALQIIANDNHKQVYGEDISITSVFIENEKGEKVTQIDYNASFTIVLYYKLHASVLHPYFGIMINKNEAPVAQMHMHVDGITITDLPKEGKVICKIDKPNLATGVYEIEVSVLANPSVNMGKKRYADWRKYTEFSVLPGQLRNKLSNISSMDLYTYKPAVILEHSWILQNIQFTTMTESQLL